MDGAMYDKNQALATTTTRDDYELESPTQPKKLAANGTLLLPQPSDDPRDPLNWPKWRKYVTFGTLCLAAFAGLGSAIAHANGLIVQAKVYHTTPTAMSYSVCSAVAGLMAGPYLIIPLARIIGTSAVIFWSLVGMIACGIWSAEMTGHDQYIGFVLSRLFGGLFSSIPQILGNGVIVNIFFLHERGRAFAVYTTSFALGVVAGPTFDGFIVEHTGWDVEFWWTVGLQILILILVFIFLEETTYDRSGSTLQRRKHGSFLADRFSTFFAGSGVARLPSGGEFLNLYIVPVKIFFSPVTILAGIFDMINFGWAVLVSTLLGIFLQEPKAHGGYAFSPQQAAGFCFTLWLGVLAAQVYGYVLNDRIPLWITSRHDGIWKPEYRLWTLWPLSLVCNPIGLGLFGAALQYELHYMVLALGCFFIYLSSNGAVPMPTNYLVETFREHPQEVGTALNAWRLLLGLIIPFFMDQWQEEVGVGWVFGMAAFFNIFASLLIFVLIWKGPAIRKLSLEKMGKTEEGVRIKTDKGSV